MDGRDHLGARETAAGHQGIEVHADQQRQEQEQPAGMGREATLSDRELAHVRDGVCGRPGTIRAFVVGTPGQTSEPFFAKHLLDGGSAEAVLARVLELVADVVNGQVALAQGDNAFANRIFLGLRLGAVEQVTEELAVHMVAEAPA